VKQLDKPHKRVLKAIIISYLTDLRILTHLTGCLDFYCSFYVFNFWYFETTLKKYKKIIGI